MLRFLALLLCLLPLHAATIVLVRHAEKAGPTGDVHLSDAGKSRAALLSRMLRDLKFTKIYTTEFLRTRQTAEPLARQQQIQPTVIPAKDLDSLIENLKSAATSDIILVVSHSNLVPAIAARLASAIPDMEDSDYSRLILINTSNSQGSLVTLRFGE